MTSSWRLELLGSPVALSRHDRVTKFRTRKTAVLLAWLARSDAPCERQEVARLIWPASDTPRNNLSQELFWVRTHLPGLVRETRETLALDHRRLTIDVREFDQRWQALREPVATRERYDTLKDALRLWRGPFLAPVQDATLAEGWVESERQRLNYRARDLYLALGALEQERGDTGAAYEAAVAAAVLCPEDDMVREWVFQLGQEGSRRRTTLALAQRTGWNTWEEALAQVTAMDRELRRLTLKEEIAFEQILDARIGTVAARERDALLRLSLLDAPVGAEDARGALGVSEEALLALHQAQLLGVEAQSGRYSVPAPLVAVLRRRLPRRVQLRLRRQHARFVLTRVRRWGAALEAMGNFWSEPDAECKAQIAALRNAAASEIGQIRQAHSFWIDRGLHPEALDIARIGLRLGLLDVLPEDPDWVERCLTAPDTYALTAEDTYLLAHNAGVDALNRRRFLRARRLFEIALRLFDAAALSPERLPHYLETLSRFAVSCHHGGDFEAVIAATDHASALCRTSEYRLWVTGLSQLRSESLAQLGRREEAYVCAREAASVYRAAGVSPLILAESLYQVGMRLSALGRWDEAVEKMEAALGIRQRAGDAHGVADCLRAMGVARAHTGRLAEGRALCEHALLLYERQGALPSRAAALGSLGDVLHLAGDPAGAKTLYEEGLAFWSEEGSESWRQSFRTRLSRL